MRRQPASLVTPAAPLASVHLGYYDDRGALCYSGNVGTGFQSFATELLSELRGLATTTCPFSPKSRPTGREYRDGRWVRPVLVGEVEFLEWTPDGRIRHPSFKALRRDRPAGEIRREVPVR